MHPQTNKVPENAIAVIGMDCRFPGANDTRQFWKNLVSGTESITFFTDDELRGAGIHPETIADPTYVRAAGIMEDAELFDAAFFGYTPTEAICIDPQQCQFLQTCWHALEDAGYNPYTYPGAVAVFGGTRLSTYYVNYMCADLADYGTARFMQGHIGTDRDHLCTRVSYKLNLRGPAFNLQCACSTSLVSVHLACQSLLNGECDMALAGASGIDIPQEHGHFYQEGMIFSPDGHCRPYDAQAEGIVSGNGVGVVLLKRLEDACATATTSTRSSWGRPSTTTAIPRSPIPRPASKARAKSSPRPWASAASIPPPSPMWKGTVPAPISETRWRSRP